MRLIDVLLALPIIVTSILILSLLGQGLAVIVITIGILFTPVVSRTVRAAVIGEREREYVTGGAPPRRALLVRHGARDPAQHHTADHRGGHGTAGLRGLHRRHSVVPGLRWPRAAVARLGPHHRHRAAASCRSLRGRCCSPPSPSRPSSWRSTSSPTDWEGRSPNELRGESADGHRRRSRPRRHGPRGHVPPPRPQAAGAQGRHAQDRERPGLRARRRVGLRQDHPRHGRHALPRRQRHARQRSRAGRRPGRQRTQRRGPAQVARRQGRDGLPGPDPGAESRHAHRRPARRGLPLPRGPGQEGGHGEGAREPRAASPSPTRTRRSSATRSSSRAASSSASSSRWRWP